MKWKRSCVPVRSSGAKPSLSNRTRSARSRPSMTLTTEVGDAAVERLDEGLTANMTANMVDICGRWRTMTESSGEILNSSGRWWTAMDARPAVFKTVCGALLRRPGWVRFPSIPASFGFNDSQDDSQNHKRFSKPFVGWAAHRLTRASANKSCPRNKGPNRRAVDRAVEISTQCWLHKL